MHKALLPTLLAVALAGCPPTIDTGADGCGAIVVGPEGGIFVREGAVLDVPRGAVDADTTLFITITDVGIPEVPGRKRVSYGFRLTPKTVKFNTPVKLILPWIDDRIPRAVDPGTFDVRRNLDAEAYAQLPGTKTLTEFKAMEAQTDKAGLFWITSPTEPNVARLEIDPPEATLIVGQTQQFTARVIDPLGGSIDAEVIWSTLPPRVGTLDATGLFTATDPGLATLTARAGMQTATATVSVIGTAVGPRTWVHANPFPTGNDLYGGALAPGGLGTLFVGENATVLARSAANQWTRLFSSPGVRLTGVGGSTADNAVAVGVTGNAGVLVEFKGATAAPAVRTFASVLPTSLWFDGTYGMAAGTGNDVLLRKNGAWALEYSPTFERILDVEGDGAGSFVVVGAQGSIYKYDPARSVWDSLYQTQLSVLLQAGVLVDAQGQEAWAVGGNKLWHFQGGGWTAQNLPVDPVLTQATALGQVDGRTVIAGRVGKQGVVLIHNPLATPTDGGTPADAGTGDGGLGDAGVVDAGVPLPYDWSLVTLRTPQIPRGFFGAGPTSTTGLVVGDLGAVWEWNTATGTFDEVSYGFYGDVADLAVTADDVFAGVNECANAQCTTRRGRVMHQGDGGLWEPLGATQPFSGPIRSIVARSATDVLVGADVAIWKFDGTAWSRFPLSGGLSGDVLDMKWCGATLWAAGEGGAVYRGTATTFAFSNRVGSGDVYAVHCPSPDEVWVAGDGLLAMRNATGVWAARNTQGVNHQAWRAVWSPGQSEGFAFGDARYGVYWDTTQLVAQEQLGPILPDIVNAMWGSSIDNLYMVGLARLPAPFGFALRFDGVQWTLVDSGSQRSVTAIDGIGPTTIWVGTEGGGVLKAVPPN